MGGHGNGPRARRCSVGKAQAAERKIADCDGRLAKYRAALEAGADALVVASWMREVQGERLAAERELKEIVPGKEQLTVDDVRSLVGGVRDAVELLATADPVLKA